MQLSLALALEEKNRHLRAYEDTIKEQKTLNVLLVRFINLGIPRSGKTTFWKRLTKQEVKIGEEEEPSTEAGDEQKPVLIKQVTADSGVITPEEWHMLSDSKYADMLLQFLSQSNSSSVNSAKSTFIGLMEKSVGGSSEGLKLNLPATSAQSSNSSFESSAAEFPISSAVAVESIEKNYSMFFDMVSESDRNSLSCDLNKIILLRTTDTGGHAEFLDMHAALINGPSFYLFFSRLTDDLKKVFPVTFKDRNHVPTPAKDSDSTVEEVMFQSLSSIAHLGDSHSAENAEISELMKIYKAIQSRVMFLGTFKDKVSDKEFDEKKEA